MAYRCLECDEIFIEPGIDGEDPGYSGMGGGAGAIYWLCCPACGSEIIEEFDEDKDYQEDDGSDV